MREALPAAWQVRISPPRPALTRATLPRQVLVQQAQLQALLLRTPDRLPKMQAQRLDLPLQTQPRPPVTQLSQPAMPQPALLLTPPNQLR